MNFTPNPSKTPDVVQKTTVSYTSRDTLFAYLCIPVCYLFVKSTPIASSALDTLLSFLIALAFTVTYLFLCKKRPSLVAYVTGGVTVLLCIGFLTNASAGLRALLSLYLMLLLLVFVYTCCEKDIFGTLPKHPLQRLADGIILAPLNSLTTNLAVYVPQKDGKKSRILPVFGWCAVGLLGAIIPTLIVAGLLSYDEQFTNLLNRIFSFSPEKIFESIGDIILSLLLGVMLFAVLFTNVIADKKPADTAEASEKTTHGFSLQIFPKPLVAAFVTPILLLYVLFFISQWSYYVSAFTHVLPEGLTYAQYAREGFFQLCTVCVFNALLMICMQAFMRRAPEEKGILRRILAGIISLFTLILIATALSKMVLYIDAYGMTQARVLATWAILLLAVIFILSLIHVFCKKFPLFIAILLTCVLFSLILFLPNINGIIADYNVDAYLSGKLSSVDVEALRDLDYAAAPALSRLEEYLLSQPTLDESATELLTQAKEHLDYLAKQNAENPDGFFDFNIPLWSAKQLLSKRG